MFCFFKKKQNGETESSRTPLRLGLYPPLVCNSSVEMQLNRQPWKRWASCLIHQTAIGSDLITPISLSHSNFLLLCQCDTSVQLSLDKIGFLKSPGENKYPDSISWELQLTFPEIACWTKFGLSKSHFKVI